MKIEFSRHATDQLKIRQRITKKMILEAINYPDNIVSSFRDRQLYQKNYGKEILEVVTIEENGIILVITQYFWRQQ